MKLITGLMRPLPVVVLLSACLILATNTCVLYHRNNSLTNANRHLILANDSIISANIHYTDSLKNGHR